MVGYSMSLRIEKPDSCKPLSWTSWSQAEQVCTGGFLEDPGVPVQALLDAGVFSNTPAKILELAADVPALQYPMLQAMLKTTAAVELAQSNPLLFILLVDHGSRNSIDEQHFERLVQGKRTAILREMGMVSSNSAVRILARTALPLRRFNQLRAVQRVLREQQLLTQMCHVKQPTIAAFHMLAGQVDPVWPGLLNMLQPEMDEKTINFIIGRIADCQRMGATYNQLQQTASPAGLDRLHDRLVARYNAQDYDRRIVQLESLYGDYPAAPVPDTECIRALTSWADLVHEGKAMRHCVVSRHSEIAKGRQFIYRVWGKQRLTLALAYNGDDWRVYEVRGFANCDPVQEDMDMIQRWLTEHNHGAGVTARAVS